jgi:hypothetical protein
MVMFESRNENIAERIYQDNIPDIVRHMIANGIQTACQVSRNILTDASAMGIPRSKAFNTACNLTFLINSTMTKAIDENNLARLTYDEQRTGHGRPIVHYMSDKVVFHIKKERSAEKLPHGAKYRREETKKNEQILLLDEPQEEVMANMVVTFNHKNFQVQYIQIGMIDPEYQTWLGRWPLLSYIQPENVERMRKEYGEPLEEQARELIRKNFQLEMRR